MPKLSVQGFRPVFPQLEKQKEFYEKLGEKVKPILEAQHLARARSEDQARNHLID